MTSSSFGFMPRRNFTAAGLVTPSQMVSPSRSRSAKEYTLGSVFSRYALGSLLLLVCFLVLIQGEKRRGIEQRAFERSDPIGHLARGATGRRVARELVTQGLHLRVDVVEVVQQNGLGNHGQL